MITGSQLLRAFARWIPAGALVPFGRPVVLTFHGVVARMEDPRLEVNHHTIDEFTSLAKTLRSHFDVLPLASLDDVLRHPKPHSRAVFLTADDGYRNVLTNAADVLENLRLPWSLFVSTRHIESGEPNPLFLARLFLYFAPNGRYVIPYFRKAVELGRFRDHAASEAITFLKTLEESHAREVIETMTSAFSGPELRSLIARFPSEQFLSWSEVGSLAKRGVEIGAHAHWHWPMNAAQSREQVEMQARLSRDLVQRHIGQCRYFSYPFGNVQDVSGVAWRAVRDAGYNGAFTTMSAALGAACNAWLLPRYTLTPNEPNLAALLPMLRAGNSRLAHWQRQLAV